MILSTKGRYAVMALVDIAKTSQNMPITLAAISERQEIPLAYLEQIFSRLKHAGIVSSVRGPGGGYKLSKHANEITMSDIMTAADEQIKMTRCGGATSHGCMTPKTRCLTHDLWDGLGQHIHHYLRSITLIDVCEGNVKSKSDALALDMGFLTLANQGVATINAS